MAQQYSEIANRINAMCLKGQYSLLNTELFKYKDVINKIATRDGRTPLIAASVAERLNLIDHLIVEMGVNVNFQDKDGLSALAYAARAGAEKSVEKLLKHGATIDLKDFDGNTPLMWTCRFYYGYVNHKVMLLLLKNGADINTQNKFGITPMMWCCIYGKPDSAKFFLENGANVDIQDAKGNTAFMHVCNDRIIVPSSAKSARLLLEYGANIELKNKEGKTALMMAKEHNNIEILNMIN